MAAMQPIGNELLPRIASAMVLGAIVLAAAWIGSDATAVVLMIAAGIVYFEWARITREDRNPTIFFVGTVVLAILLVALGIGLAGFAVAGAAVIAASATSPRAWRPAGVAYASAFGLSLLTLRDAPLGLEALVFVFAVTWATDTGAYFGGRGIGGAKLWPAVSPKKTWSGAISGVVAAVVAGFLVVWAFGLPVSLPLLLVTLALSVACQAGDLFESAVKRHFGVKDAGHVIPGHGGLMDRVDGLIFVGIAATLIGLVHAGPAHLGEGLLLW